ncbi:MAG: hypothetical protein KAW56_01235 [Candidatus Marinimicrobia bacterium]|nr:hypothetical protein [Candidatus Neomarinimicrobiota bacterium]
MTKDNLNKFLLLLIWLNLTFSCEEGLDPVAGIEGKINIPTDSLSENIVWPDSLQGAVIVIAEFGLYESLDSFFTHIVTFSDPLDTSKEEQSYFVQTLPGFYIASIIGITEKMSEIIFLLQDSLSMHLEYFVPIGLYKLPNSTLPIGIIRVQEKEIIKDIDITINYDIELPF